MADDDGFSKISGKIFVKSLATLEKGQPQLKKLKLCSVDERLQPNYSTSFQSVLSSSPGGRYTISTPKYGSLNFSEGNFSAEIDVHTIMG